MFNPERLLGQLLINGLSGRQRDSHAASRGAGLFGAKGSLGMGVLGVAIAAFEHFSNQQRASSAPPSAPAGAAPPWPPATATPPVPAPRPSTTPAAPPPPLPTQPSIKETVAANPPTISRQDQALWLIRAMIAAAAADGEIDANERGKILDAAANSGMPPEDLEALQRELATPRSILELAAIGQPRDLAMQIYTASLVAIEVDTEAEQQYLNRLASALRLTPADVTNLHQQMGV